MPDPEPIDASEFQDPGVDISSMFDETNAQARERVAKEQAEEARQAEESTREEA